MDSSELSDRPSVPRILVFATLRWQLAARMAIAFSEGGCHVDVLCPRGNPARLVSCVRQLLSCSLLVPVRSARRAIAACSPDLVVPVDDGAALVLQRLYRWSLASGTSQDTLRVLLERSLGSPEACLLAGLRGQFMELASRLGVRVPPSAIVSSVAGLRDWIALHGLPVVLKSDFSYGGKGVSIAHTSAEAEGALLRMMQRPRLWSAIFRSAVDRDINQLLAWVRPAPSSLLVQRCIVGRPANRAVACWNGEVLAGISVEALRTQHATGPSTVVCKVNSAEMETATRRIVQELNISGLVGVDFMVEGRTGAAFVIEMNPRATPACHLPRALGVDLPASLTARLLGRGLPLRRNGLVPGVVTLFPGEWRANAASPYLHSGCHDVPWEYPALVLDGLEPAWEERGWLARALAAWRGGAIEAERASLCAPHELF